MTSTADRKAGVRHDVPAVMVEGRDCFYLVNVLTDPAVAYPRSTTGV